MPLTEHEKEIEHMLKGKIERIGGRCLKFSCPGYTGVPDRLVLLPGGIVFFVELKAPGQTERKRQAYVQQLLRRLGFVVFSAVDSKEDVMEVVNACKGAMRL